MQLSDEIINAFVKTLPNGEKDNSNGYELYYGTVKVSNGKTSVILDGSHVETPLNYLTMGAENGDRVTCIIKDHSLIVTGNLTHPSEGMTTKYIETMTVLAQEAAIGKLIATEGDFTELTADSAFVKRLMSDQVGASILTADEAFVGSLQSKIVTADKIKAMQAEIGYVDAETLEANYIDAKTIKANYVDTKTLKANYIDAETIRANYVDAETLKANYVNIKTLEANYIDANTIKANYVDTKTLQANYIDAKTIAANYIDANTIRSNYVDIKTLQANYIDANTLKANYVDTKTLKANYMDAATIKAGYLQADMANLKIVEATKASIATLLADIALIKNATISQGHITGALDSVTLNANKITAGSLSVDRLYINGSDGKPRLVKFDASGKPVATTIDASILTDRTVTADKLVANSITANEISTDFITAFRADIMQTVAEHLEAIDAEIQNLISGDTTITSLTVKSNASVGGKLTVTGSTILKGSVTMNSTLNVDGAITAKSLTLSTPLPEKSGGTGVNNFNDLFKVFRNRDYRLKYTHTNLINPTKPTTTWNGVTFTNNGDGTYTVNGTASATAFIIATSSPVDLIPFRNKDIRIAGCPSGGGANKYQFNINIHDASNGDIARVIDYGEGSTYHVPSNAHHCYIVIAVLSGYTANNLLYKPMLTTDLNATYDDFVQYSGDGELNENVAEIYDTLKNVEIRGSNNLFDIKCAEINANQVRYVNGSFENVITDTRTFFDLQLQFWNGTEYLNIGDAKTVNTIGIHSLTSKVPTNATRIRVKHNGEKNDITFCWVRLSDLGLTAGDPITISIKANKINPRVQYGIQITDMQIEKSIMASEYTPNYKSISALNEVSDRVSDETHTNLLNPTAQTRTIHGVTFTNNGDGTYTVNGTASNNTYFKFQDVKLKKGTYKLTGRRPDPLQGAYIYTADYKFSSNGRTDVVGTIDTDNYNQPLYMLVASGVTLTDEVIKPMLTTKLDATYNDYIPYSGSGALNENVAEIYKVSDRVSDETRTNLLNPTAQTRTYNGVTFTNNGDGTYTVNGTATATAVAWIILENNFDLTPFRGKSIRIAGCPSGGGANAYRFLINIYDASDTIISTCIDYGEGRTCNIPSNATDGQFVIDVRPGYTVNNLLFKPMLTTDLNAKYDDYAPYTGGSGRLNEDVAQINAGVSELKATSPVKPEAKKWFCFADSYGAFNDSYTVKLKSLFGSRFNYKSQSGMRWMNTPSVTDRYPFKNKLNEWLPSIDNKESYTDILIELGTNDIDSYSEANLISGFNECINLIHNSFSTAIIHIGIVSKDMRASRWNTRQRIIKKLKELCGTRTYTTWISGNENILGAKNQTWDLLHPTANTSTYIARCLAEYMVGGNCPQYTQEETITNLVRSGSTLQLHEEYSNGVYSLYINGSSAGGFQTTKEGTISLIGTVSMPIIHRAITVNGWINTYLEYSGTVYRNILPASILLIPNESNNNVDVYLSWAYSSFYRDGSGNAIPWQQEMTIGSFTFSGQQTTQIQ